MSPHYDTIGKTYTATRHADPRITARLIELLALDPDARLIDIGAGTGNYSNALARAGYRVIAVEPSPVMRRQTESHARVHWCAGIAERLPFPDRAFDGAVMTLCLHHIGDWRQGIAEALRVSQGGPLVVFAFDPRCKTKSWLFDYFPKFAEIERTYRPTMEQLQGFAQAELAASIERFPFPLPKDLEDHFAGADWARPEAYLESRFRCGISSFARLGEEELDRGVEQLRKDLYDGSWQLKYGQLMEQDCHDQGYLFLRLRRS